MSSSPDRRLGRHFNKEKKVKRFRKNFCYAMKRRLRNQNSNKTLKTETDINSLLQSKKIVATHQNTYINIILQDHGVKLKEFI